MVRLPTIHTRQPSASAELPRAALDPRFFPSGPLPQRSNVLRSGANAPCETCNTAWPADLPNFSLSSGAFSPAPRELSKPPVPQSGAKCSPQKGKTPSRSELDNPAPSAASPTPLMRAHRRSTAAAVSGGPSMCAAKAYKIFAALREDPLCPGITSAHHPRHHNHPASRSCDHCLGLLFTTPQARQATRQALPSSPFYGYCS